MELEGDGGSGFFPQGNGYYSNYNAIRSTISSALSGLSMAAGGGTIHYVNAINWDYVFQYGDRYRAKLAYAHITIE